MMMQLTYNHLMYYTTCETALWKVTSVGKIIELKCTGEKNFFLFPHFFPVQSTFITF